MAAMMPFTKRRDLLVVIAFTVTVIIWFHLLPYSQPTDDYLSSQPQIIQHIFQHTIVTNPEDEKWADHEPSSNSTLGFGRIIAVSHAKSSRKANLLMSANLTDLDITIPDQPKWTDKDISDFKVLSKENSKTSRGSAMAWLGHINALKWFLESGDENALLIEDDVNWDVRIRTHQIPLLHRAFYDYFARDHNTTTSSEPPTKPTEQETKQNYWPPSHLWDILYIGHCGDFFPASHLPEMKHMSYPDPTTPAFYGLHSDTQKQLSLLPLPRQHRLIHPSKRPLCTFAYAVNRRSAARIIADLGVEGPGGTYAFDVRILEACRDMGYRCLSVNPELFHHMNEMASEIRVVMAGNDDELRKLPDFFADPPSEEDTRKARNRGTPNIRCGVRTIVDRLGAGDKIRQAIRLAQQVDGLCPVTTEEIDLMRSEIVEAGRPDLPI